VSRGTESTKCDCGQQAYIDGYISASVGFTSGVDESMKVQTTGVDSFDLDFDRVIGEDARQKWEQIYRRRRDKWDLIEKHKVSGADLIRMEDQTYEVLPEMGTNLRTSRMNAMENIKSNNSNQQEK
tara:strand:- start:795 stop:1172 length:378 start_codon:yes stop_codon:yes gene_type:complete